MPDTASAVAQGVLPNGNSCSGCAALVDPADSFCNYCGTRLQDESPAPTAGQQLFRCTNCSSEMSADPEQRSYVCPFCDAAHVVEFTREATGRQDPEFVIGFAVEAERAPQIYRDWIRSNSFFRPGDLPGAQVEGKLRGIYIPFWSFSMFAESSWTAEVGEHWYRTETYTTQDSNGKTVTRTRQVRETEWWPLSGHHHDFHSHYLVSGSHGLDQSEADAVKPFHLAALHRYAPRYLAGWLTEEYSVECDAAQQVSIQEFHRREQEAVARFLPGDTHRALRVSTQFSRASSDLILLPVYLATYRYRGKQFRFLVNGQTGKIAGDKPLSALRVAFAVLAALAVIAAIVLWVTR